MKRTSITIFLVSFITLTFAQYPSLHLATNKTTTLIFPFPVKYVDRGSPDVLVQQVKEADNILLVKAATSQLSETNLTVITGEGTVYAFRVNYMEDPGTMVWKIPEQDEVNVATYAKIILDNPQTVHGIQSTNLDISGNVAGIYIRGENIFYQLQLHNRGTIDYDMEQLRFSIRNRRKVKRTAMQEIELKPLYVAGNIQVIKANSSSSIVVALPKFTLPDAKFLAIQITEKNGGRKLFMRVHNRNIIRATALAGFK